ncbi:MAG: prepilin-type N-terminal cleavage/methylation domain-containing protein [Candidatus Brocadiia bacterium]
MRTYRAQSWASEADGFTLIEVLVVLTIIAVSFGLVAFAAAGRPGGTRLDREAARMARWIRVVTLRAAENGEAWTVRYDLGAGAYTAWPQSQGGDTVEPRVSHRLPEAVSIVQVVRTAEQAETTRYGVIEVHVYQDGTCTPHAVTLAQSGAGERTLRVNPVTGAVSVVRGVGQFDLVSAEAFTEEPGG